MGRSRRSRSHVNRVRAQRSTIWLELCVPRVCHRICSERSSFEGFRPPSWKRRVLPEYASCLERVVARQSVIYAAIVNLTICTETLLLSSLIHHRPSINELSMQK